MNAPPWPMNPAVGEWFQNWIWNGSRWVCSRSTGIRVLTQVFTASGPYQPSPGLVSLTVECIGGGGTGGSVQGVSDATIVCEGAGGGSGGYSRKTLPAALVAGGVNVTVGQGGGGAGNPAGPYNGDPTSFGAFCVANGGYGAPGPTAGTQAGAGADAGVGDVAMPGARGMDGSYYAVPAGAVDWVVVSGGLGGVLFGGNNGSQVGPGSVGNGMNGAPNTGAGASGGIINQNAAPSDNVYWGGWGGSGLCIVTEYCWADSASDGEDCVNPAINVNARVTMAQDDCGPGKPGPGPWPGKPGWGPRPPQIGPFEGDWDDGQS